MPFDSKYALNDAIRYLTKVAERRAAGGWVPPKEEERRRRELIRLQQSQHKQLVTDEKERQKNLMSWHKGSHPYTLNDDGFPRTFYHGTTRDFSNFRMGRKGQPVEAIFVSPDVDLAHIFAMPQFEEKGDKPNVMPVHVATKNPFDYENPQHVDKVIKGLMQNKDFMDDYGKTDLPEYVDGLKKGSWQMIEDPWVQEQIRLNGHDGFFAEGRGTKFLGVYSPHQIKSATGNQGTFDPSNPDITKSEGGQILSKQFPTQYMPNVGRQVMADGGDADRDDLASNGKVKRHPALSISGTHIREETHGEPMFTGRL
jgi:hypothetical protein